MKEFFPTVVIGAFFALVTIVMVLLYWLMIVAFRILYALTLPLHSLWRGMQS